jgi:hypothetical protein
MATYNKFNAALENQFISGIDWDANTFKVMLTNTAPVATQDTFDDLTEIAAGSGYTARGTATTITVTRSSGTTKVAGSDVVFTASGGSIGPFRYATLYDDTASSDQLIGFWDYGSSITLADGESFTTDFDASAGVLTLA